MSSILSALVSLPALPLLYLTSNTGMATSLNLLFFQITWSALVIGYQPLMVELAGTLVVRAIFFLLPSLILLTLDMTTPAVANNWKSRTARRKVKNNWNVVGIAILNIVLATALQGAIEYLLTNVLHVRSAIRVPKTLPIPTSALWDFLRAELMREALTYMIHRYVLHQPANFGRQSTTAARLHQKWAHSGYGACTGSFSAHYDHPIPYLLLHFVPSYLPMAIFIRMHALTFFVHLSLISLIDVIAYSGLTDAPTGFIPFGFMLGWMAQRVDGHYSCNGRRAFGIWGIADWVMGTRVETGGEEYLKGKWGDVSEGFLGDGDSKGKRRSRT